jgi:hypothetical protein
MILEVLSEAGPIQVNPIIHNATNPLGSNGRQQRRGQMPAPAFLPLGKHGGSVFSVAGATKHAVISRTHRWTGPPAADRQPLSGGAGLFFLSRTLDVERAEDGGRDP